jgi:hypothetical protein
MLLEANILSLFEEFISKDVEIVAAIRYSRHESSKRVMKIRCNLPPYCTDQNIYYK